MRELDDDDDDVEDDDEEDEDRMKKEETETEIDDEEEVAKKGRFEDEFLNLNELEEYLEKDEEREYGVKNSGKKKNKKGKHMEASIDDEEKEEDEGESEEDELDLFGGGAEEDDDELGDLKYNDFFGSNKKKEVKRKSDLIDGSEDSETDEEDDKEDDASKKKKLSTFQKEQLKREAQIAELERQMLEPKTWAMLGEVTAAHRPKNSALEVDLDFEHNVRPAPVITEEVTVSLEEMIKKRIIEGRFDDVQKPPGLPAKAPRERKELDETKSKKGLGEIYEDEYVQKTNPNAAPITFSDELKKEASMIFKKLCVKLDALSHFNFAPKPIIEDMTIQSNLPALAMEEVAPVAISDAAMLAPEEVYDGKGIFKEETELTKPERKRRRANKKRKFKEVAAKRAPKRAKEDTVSNYDDKEIAS